MILKQFFKRLLYFAVLFLSVGIYSQCLSTSNWNIGNSNSGNPINIPNYFNTNTINVGAARMTVAMTLNGNATLNTARISDTHLGERGINLGHDSGSNTNSFANRVEMDVSFSLPVVNLAFRINDVDDRDNVIITAYNENNVAINLGAMGTTSPYWSYPANTAIVYQGSNRFRGGDPDVSSTAGSIYFNYTGLKISRVKIEYYDETNDGSFTAAAFSGSTQCPITANPDYFNATKNIALTTGGSVLGNDLFNSLQATTSNLTVSAVGALPAGFTLNANGTVTVANTVPVGVYRVNYQICETAGVSNCSTSYAVISVNEDTDGDTVPDYLDLDDDNDGILDTDECEPTNIINNGSFAGNISGWTAGTGWVYSSANGQTAINESDVATNSVLSQSVTNLVNVENGIVRLNLRVGAQDNNNAATTTSALEILLNGTVYATLRNGVLRNSTNITLDVAAGVSSTFTTFGTGPTTGFNYSAPFTINIPYTGPNTAVLAFRMVAGPDDWSIDDVSINASICDTDGDGIRDSLDTDSDGDSCFDAIEGDENVTAAQLTAGRISGAVNANGVPVLVNAGGAADIGGDIGQGFGYSRNNSLNACKDADGDGIIDNLDLDSDNDGVLDTDEGSFCGKIGRNIRVGYLAVGAADDGLATNLLLNLNNFGTYGTYKNVTGVTLVPFATVASVTEANLISSNIDVFFVGSTADDNGNATGTSSANKAPTSVNNILTTWARNTGKVIFAIQNNAVDFGYLTTNNNANNDVPFGAIGNQVYTNGYWPTSSLTQSGSVQMTIGSNTRLFNTLMVDANGRPVVVSDQEYNLVIFPDATIYISEANEALPTTNDRRAIADTWAYVFNLFVSKQCTSLNTDGDAQPNHLDLDSDGDGCSDAFEAGATTSLAANYTFASVAGTASDSNSDGLADAVDGTPLDGIPNYVSTYEIATNASNRKCLDSDGDGILDSIDLDDDNDGILDTDEGFACTSLSRNLRIGYLNTVVGRNGLMINMLSNAVNFSYTGTYKKFPGITFVPYATEAAITEAQLLADNIDLFYSGSSANDAQTATDKLSTALNTRILAWINNNNKGAIILQNNAPDYGYQVTNNNANDNVPYGVVGRRVFTNGYWPESTFAQSGSVQMTISSLTNAYDTAMVDAQGKSTFIKDKNRKIVFFPDATIFESNVSATTINNSTLRVAADVWAYAFDVFLQDVCSSTDTDGDGIPNYLDLDSDGDGCPDAREGAGDFNPSTPASGPIAAQTPNTNFGTAVNTTTGIPTLVGAGQGVGQSQSFAQNDCLDTDGDTIPDWQDLDDDNDGILDTVECSNTVVDLANAVAAGTLKDILPSDFGLALNAKNQNVTADLSAKFGYPANSGAVVVSITNASVNPTANAWWTKQGQLPSVWKVTGTMSAFVLMAQDTQYYGNDSKTIHIYDSATVIPITSGATPNQTAVANQWAVSESPTQKTLTDLDTNLTTIENGNWRFANMNFGPKTFGFSTTTAIADPAYAVLMYLECDADGDGIPNRLDLDSDNDGCPDAIEGAENVTRSQLNPNGSINIGLVAPNNGVGSLATDLGVPRLVNSGGSADTGTATVNTVGQPVGTSQNASVNSCFVEAQNDINQTPVGVSSSGSVLTNDKALDGTAVTVTSATYLNSAGVATPLTLGTSTTVYDAAGVLAGTVTLNSNGAYTFIPAANYTGTVPVTYTISNTSGSSASATLSIEVGAVVLAPGNNKPIAQNDTGTAESGTNLSSNVLLNDSDPDANPLVVTTASVPLGTPTQVGGLDINGNTVANAGTLTLNANGTYTFSPASTFTGTVNPVTYTACDNGTPALCDTASLSIKVVPNSGNNTFANDDAKAVPKGTAITTTAANGVLANDSDPEGNTQTVTTVNGVAINATGTTNVTVPNGTLVFSANGSYTFTPNATFVGTVVLPYTVCDNVTPQACDTATLYLTLLDTAATVCYEDPALVAGATYPVRHGITLLGRAGATNGNWPMLRNSAYTALESKTKGFVVTRNSSPETTIAIPVVGMMVFDTDENAGAGCLKIYTGPAAGEGWKCFSTQGCP